MNEPMVAENKAGNRAQYRAIEPAASEKRSYRHRASLWLLGGTTLRELTAQTWANLLLDDLTGRSAQLAYYFFLSLFPGLIFVSSMVGLIAGSQSELQDHLLDSFGTFLPPAAYTLVSSTFAEIVQSSTAGKAALGVLFAVWSATSGVSAVQDALNGVYRVKETRPYWKTTLVALLLTVFVGVFGFLAIVAFFYGENLVDLVSKRIGLSAGLTFLWKLAQWPIAIFDLAVVAAVVYHFAPNVKRKKWLWITPGSVIGIAGWLAVSGIFRAYLHFFNRFSLTYGSLGAVIILLLWFYLSGFMLLFGAEINSTIEQAVSSRAQPGPSAASASGDAVPGV
jgi:membrane protein